MKYLLSIHQVKIWFGKTMHNLDMVYTTVFSTNTSLTRDLSIRFEKVSNCTYQICFAITH